MSTPGVDMELTPDTYDIKKTLMKQMPVIEVKRAFVIANLMRVPLGRKRYLGALSKKDFVKRLTAAKKKVLLMDESRLNTLISPNWPRRLRAYNACTWRILVLKTENLGVWKRAGGMPLSWTRGSLAQTAKKVERALVTYSSPLAARARRAIPNIMPHVARLQREKHLFPIVFRGGTGTNGRRGLKIMKGDIDDGCMRSVALAISGKKKIKVYFGTPVSIHVNLGG